MNNTSAIIFAFFVFPALSIKILSIGDVEEDQKFNITIKNFPLLMTSKFSFFWWVKIYSKGDNQYLGTDGVGGPSIAIWDGVGQTFWVDGIWAFNYPRRLQVVPHIFEK